MFCPRGKISLTGPQPCLAMSHRGGAAQLGADHHSIWGDGHHAVEWPRGHVGAVKWFYRDCEAVIEEKHFRDKST